MILAHEEINMCESTKHYICNLGVPLLDWNYKTFD